VHQILINDKYIGNNVFNRESFKLRKTRIQNPPSAWVRADHSFEPIVEVSSFRAARRLLDAKPGRLSNDEMLARLRSCFEKHGRLTGAIINSSKGMPCSATYLNHFGTLRRAYALVGYCCREPYGGEKEVYKKAIAKKRILLRTSVEIIKNAGWAVRLNAGGTSFVVDGSISVAIRVTSRRTCDRSCWDITLGRYTRNDITVVARIERDGETLLDYYLFPKSVLRDKEYFRFVGPRSNYEDHRFESLDSLLTLIGRLKKRRARRLRRARPTAALAPE
jgi:hypothetical protein